MEKRYFSNNATTTVVSDGNTVISVTSASAFPTQYPFYVTAETASLAREIIKVTGSPSSNTWTVQRAQEGTTQRTFALGDKIELRLTSDYLNTLTDEVNTTVRLTGSQEISGRKIFNSGVVENVKNMGSDTNINMLDGSIFYKTITSAVTFTVSNPPSAGKLGSFILELTNGGLHSITWFSGIKWSGDSTPTFQTAGIDSIGFYTIDGGTTWRGVILGRFST